MSRAPSQEQGIEIWQSYGKVQGGDPYQVHCGSLNESREGKLRVQVLTLRHSIELECMSVVPHIIITHDTVPLYSYIQVRAHA